MVSAGLKRCGWLLASPSLGSGTARGGSGGTALAGVSIGQVMPQPRGWARVGGAGIPNPTFLENVSSQGIFCFFKKKKAPGKAEYFLNPRVSCGAVVEVPGGAVGMRAVPRAGQKKAWSWLRRRNRNCSFVRTYREISLRN